jgi:tetratricopeptide (TPR) repeat protein
MYLEAGDFSQVNQVTERELSRIADLNGVQDAAYRQGLLNYATLQSGEKNYAAAEKTLEQYLALTEQSGEVSDSEAETALGRLAEVRDAAGHSQEAQETRAKAMTLRQTREGPNAQREVQELAREATEALNNLNFDVAHDRMGRALGVLESSSGQAVCVQTYTLTQFFAPLHGLQRTEEAQQLAWRLASLADRNSCAEMMQPIYSGAHVLVEFDKAAGRWADAGRLLREELERLIATKGADSPGLSDTLEQFAAAAFSEGNISSAEDLKLQRLSIEETAHGPDHPVLIPVITSLASFYDATRQWDRAEPLWQQVLAQSDKSHNPADSDRAWPHSQFADSLVSRNELERALEQYNEALEILQQHPEYAAAADGIRAKSKSLEERIRAAAISPSPEPWRQTALR